MDAELKSLQIDRAAKRSAQRRSKAPRWIVPVVLLCLLSQGANH
jgi:hypothetical protein